MLKCVIVHILCYLEEIQMENYVEMFKALGEKTRLRIAHLLRASQTELCVCEMVDALEEPQYNISRHLQLLKHAGLLKERKDGRWVYYSLIDADDEFLSSLFDAISTISDDILLDDQKRLKERLDIRVDGKCPLGVQKTYLLSSSGSEGNQTFLLKRKVPS